MNNRLKVKIINRSHHPLPAYETHGSAGMDVRASLNESITLLPGHRAMIPTGLHIELPQGYECQIRPRSGLAARNGITVLNSPGTVDSDFRGEIKVILINLGDKPFVITDGERICQMVVANYTKVEWDAVTEIDKTERGDGGFGHTGLS